MRSSFVKYECGVIAARLQWQGPGRGIGGTGLSHAVGENEEEKRSSIFCLEGGSHRYERGTMVERVMTKLDELEP